MHSFFTSKKIIKNWIKLYLIKNVLIDYITISKTLIYQHFKTNVYLFVVVMYQNHNLQIINILKKN